jgi:hypothetical protein
MMKFRRLHDKHQVWYVDGEPTLGNLLVQAGLAAMQIERDKIGVITNVSIDEFIEEGSWTATFIVDTQSEY